MLPPSLTLFEKSVARCCPKVQQEIERLDISNKNGNLICRGSLRKGGGGEGDAVAAIFAMHSGYFCT